MAVALVELNDARDGLRSAARKSRSNGQELERARECLDAAVRRLEKQLGSARGVAVSDAARYLSVSAPTVRAWLKRGLLEPVPKTKPVRVAGGSLRRTDRVLAEFRRRGKDRDWLRAMVDYVHDAADRERPRVRRGLDELRRRETEPA